MSAQPVVPDLDRHHEPKLDSSLHKLDEANRATTGKQGWGVKRGCDPFQASRALSPIIILQTTQSVMVHESPSKDLSSFWKLLKCLTQPCNKARAGPVRDAPHPCCQELSVQLLSASGEPERQESDLHGAGKRGLEGCVKA